MTFSEKSNQGGMDMSIAEELELIKATVATANERANELEERLRAGLARGTADVTEEAKKVTQVPVEEKPATLTERVEQALRERPMTLPELARALGEPVGRVQAVMKASRAKMYNMGTADHPKWIWKLGQKATSKEVKAELVKLMSHQPMSSAELVDATGAGDRAVQTALIEVRRTVPNVLNLGSSNRGRWFILSDMAMDAKLAPKAPKAPKEK